MFRLPVLFLLLATSMVARATDALEDVQAVFSKAVQLLNAGHETNIERQMGKIGKDDRIYALDRNEGTTSSLCGMLTTVSYDDVRSLLIKAVEGRSGAAKAH